MPPSSHGRSGFTTVRAAPHLSHNRLGIPSDGVSSQSRGDCVGGNRFCLSVISFIADLPFQATLFHPLSRRLACVPWLPARASTTRRTCRTPLGLEPRIVIKKHRSSLSGNTVQHHAGVSGITAPFLHVPRYGGYRATLIGWVRLERGGTTCANQRSYLPWSSAF